jgi:hypothetical protein
VLRNPGLVFSPPMTVTRHVTRETPGWHTAQAHPAEAVIL